MIITDSQPALHWTCPSCAAEWFDAGRGFPGHRFSECLGCGESALEITDARATERRQMTFSSGRFRIPPR